MKEKLEYSFDDEIVYKFCYDIENRRIEIYFSGYYSIADNQYIDKQCVWTIRDWTDAKSRNNSEDNYSDLDKYFGIVSMILFTEICNDTLKLTINTIDNRYVDLLFDNPRMELR